MLLPEHCKCLDSPRVKLPVVDLLSVFASLLGSLLLVQSRLATTAGNACTVEALTKEQSVLLSPWILATNIRE